jgi:hypothetical protein
MVGSGATHPIPQGEENLLVVDLAEVAARNRSPSAYKSSI